MDNFGTNAWNETDTDTENSNATEKKLDFTV